MIYFRRALSLLLVVALLAGAAALALPASAQAASPAAPAAQGADVNELSGTYVSDVYPAASAPGLVMLLSLYPNNNAELVSYYFSNPPLIEQGTWESSDEGVTVTLTGSTERTYDTPSSETFTIGDGQLTSGNMVFEKLNVVTPEQMDAASDEAAAAQDAAAAEEPAASEEVTASAELTGTAGAYEVFVSDVYPAADASGMVMLMALFPNQAMEQLSVYLGKDALLEVGTWAEGAEGADGTIDTTITGQLDSEYETPVTATYTHDGDLLSDGIFNFHALTVRTPADLQAAVSPAGTYVSKLYPAADAPGMLEVLSLYDNNNVEQVTIYLGKAAVMEQGTWAENEDGSITVTITGSGDNTYDQPAETQYTRSGDTLFHGPFELTRVEEVTPADMDAATSAAGEAAASGTAADTTASDTAGADKAASGAVPTALYQSDELPAADSPGRVISLSLSENGDAEMTTDFLNDQVYVDLGTWEKDAGGNIVVTLTHSDEGEYANPIVITFAEKDGTLTAVDYDESLFGSEGLTLNAVGE